MREALLETEKDYCIVIIEGMHRLSIYEREKYFGDLRRDNQEI